MYHLLKININLYIKLKIFNSSSCSYTMDFINKKEKSDINFLLLALATDFI